MSEKAKQFYQTWKKSMPYHRCSAECGMDFKTEEAFCFAQDSADQENAELRARCERLEKAIRDWSGCCGKCSNVRAARAGKEKA